MEPKNQRYADDRFSNLPDEIVHHILFFLRRMKDLARLSVVSKRCQELCISNPKLFLSNMNDKSVGSHFNSFVDRFMALRCLYGVRTERFQLRWSFFDQDEGNRVETWLQHAVNLGGVAVIRLKFIHPHPPIKAKRFALLHCVLRCNSLRFLEVDAGNAFLTLPSTLSTDPYFATKLQFLHLASIKIEKDCNFGELISSFKSLKVLMLNEIRRVKSMTITSSSIEILFIRSIGCLLCDIDIQQTDKLYDLQLIWFTRSSTSNSLKISAPNLQKFGWSGFVVDYYCMRDSPHLLHAVIGLHLPAQPRGNQASTKDTLVKLLHSLRKARHLKLLDCFAEALLKQGCLPFSFDNVEHLTVDRTSSGDQVLPLSSLLRGTPNLKLLNLHVHPSVINSTPSSSRDLPFKMEYWQSQNFMFTHQLKTVAVQLLDRENEIELIKYLLKNAEKLEEMVVLYTSQVSSHVISELRKYKKPSTKVFLRSKSYNKLGRVCAIRSRRLV